MDLAELLALPGVEEICVLRSSVGFLALHGGSQDAGDARDREPGGRAVRCLVPTRSSSLETFGSISPRGDTNPRSRRSSCSLDHVEIAISVTGSGATA